MSALAPSNGKYRSMWKIFGKQLADKEMCKNYQNGYDKIKWGNVNRFEKKDKILGGHYVIKEKR